ncbi:translation initiation factor IF-2 [Rubrobacter calidifluminis]|uniref:translation initiation factor IF-2 n=1 Tax=Rubrobacter calidifluminis TaxID=1392640 RepID=UPI002360FB6C|nr:translation initiation factor IF-2 [Rubrobacter calidifluminis]
MARRVYEIARELSLDTREVMGRLNDAGVEVKNHFATIEDPVYERVFGGLSGNGGAGSADEQRRDQRDRGHSKGGRKRRRVVIDASATSRGSSRGAAEATSGHEEAQPDGGKKGGGEAAAVRVEPGATVNDLAEAIGVPGAQIVKVLFELGEMKTVTQTLSTEEIELVAEALGVKVEIGGAEEPASEEGGAEDSPEDLVEKPPVVTVMGHVDHGKTSLLDYIRNTSVASGEAGGITQHIGAYQVEVDGRRITFIDTPGHEAFTEMRARGAQVTDIVVLVVAADDGVMPQTEEAIEHARAAGVPIVVALNKIDLPDANPDRVYGELAERGLTPEAWGGETVTVPVSAKTGEGVDELLENILVVAELEELRANPKAPASGYVIESELETGRGPVATLLITRGTLHKGDVVLAGTAYGRVRAMLDYTGKRIKEATPGTPVEILGLSGVPEAGTRFEVVEHERIARSRAEQQEAALRRQELAESGPRRTLEDLLGEGGTQELNLVVKADAAGSVEALKDALAKLSTDEVRINIVRSGVGALTDSDVMLASASDGILLGFNVRPTNTAKQLAEREGVEIRTYNVIYKAIEEIEAAMRGMLAPEETERETGTAEVRQTFRVPNVGTVAGCYVSSGEISRNDRVRVVREGVVIYDGQVASLRRFKDDVRSVRQGFECGVGIENFNDVKEGDVLEFYQVVEVPR